MAQCLNGNIQNLGRHLEGLTLKELMLIVKMHGSRKFCQRGSNFDIFLYFFS